MWSYRELCKSELLCEIVSVFLDSPSCRKVTVFVLLWSGTAQAPEADITSPSQTLCPHLFSGAGNLQQNTPNRVIYKENAFGLTHILEAGKFKSMA